LSAVGVGFGDHSACGEILNIVITFSMRNALPDVNSAENVLFYFSDTKDCNPRTSKNLKLNVVWLFTKKLRNVLKENWSEN
jgi:hypothetical protein